MLTDDELDFDDFGELEGQQVTAEMTNEELERELALEFGDVDHPSSSTQEQQTKEIKNDAVIDLGEDDDLDEGEIRESEEEKQATADKEEKSSSDAAKKSEALNKPLSSSSRPYKKYNNTGGFKNNFYNQPFAPGMPMK